MTYRDLTDQELLLIANETNQNYILGLLYDRHADRLMDQAYRQTRDQWLAEETVQSTFIELMMERDWRNINNLKAWLNSIARKKAIDVFRREASFSKAKSAWGASGPIVCKEANTYDYRLLEWSFNQQMQGMHVNQRLVLALWYHEYRNKREIAAITGLSVLTVGQYLSNASKLLLRLCKEYQSVH